MTQFDDREKSFYKKNLLTMKSFNLRLQAFVEIEYFRSYLFKNFGL